MTVIDDSSNPYQTELGQLWTNPTNQKKEFVCVEVATPQVKLLHTLARVHQSPASHPQLCEAQ